MFMTSVTLSTHYFLSLRKQSLRTRHQLQLQEMKRKLFYSIFLICFIINNDKAPLVSLNFFMLLIKEELTLVAKFGEYVAYSLLNIVYSLYVILILDINTMSHKKYIGEPKCFDQNIHKLYSSTQHYSLSPEWSSS